MKLLEANQSGNLFTVKVLVKASWLSKIFGGKDTTDEMVFNIETGGMSQSGLIRRGSFDIAMHEYYKRYGTYGIPKQ